MATNNTLGQAPNYSRWQAMARGAGYGGQDDFRLAQAAKQQTDEKDFSNLDRTVSELDRWKVKIKNDWEVYNQSLTDPNTTATLPDGFVGTAKDYETSYFQARQNFGVNKNYAPTDIQRLYGKDAAIQYENISGLWGNILGDGKFMNSVTSEQVETDFGPGVNYQVRSVDPRTGRVHDANPTFGGTPVAQLQANGGDEAVEAGSWPPIPDAARDQVFFSNIADRYQRVPGASSAVRTLGEQDSSLQGYVPGRVENELRALQDIQGGNKGVYDEAFALLQDTQGAYAQQEVNIDTQFAKDKQEERKRLQDDNTALRAQYAEDAKNAQMAERNPEGTGYGRRPTTRMNVTQGGGVTGQGPIVVPPGQSDLPMGDELYDLLPEYYQMPSPPYGIAGTLDIEVPDELSDLIVPRNSTPVNMTAVQHKSLSSKQRELAENKHEDIVQKNLQTLWREQITWNSGDSRQSALRTELKEYRETDVPADISADQYDKVANDVEAFYAKYSGWGSTSRKDKFWEALRNSPDDLELFRESPFRFAEKYMNDETALTAFIGLEVKPEEIAATPLPEIKSQADINAVIEAMNRPTGTLMPSHIEVLKQEVARLDTLSQQSQQDVVEFINKFDGNMQQLDKEDRAAAWLALASTFPQGDARGTQLFSMIANSGPSLIERGRWDDFSDKFNLEQRKASQTDTSLFLQEQNLEARWEEIDLQKARYTTTDIQWQKEYNLKLRNAVSAERGSTLTDYNSGKKETNFYKMMYGTADQPSSLDDVTAFNYGDFAAFTNLGLKALSDVSIRNNGVPMRDWTPQDFANYQGIKHDLATASNVMLKKMSEENANLWTKFLSLIGADNTVGVRAYDYASELIAIGRDGNPTDDPSQVTHYKQIDPRTFQELGNEIAAIELEEVFGSLGGRSVLLGMSLGNNDAYRHARGL